MRKQELNYLAVGMFVLVMLALLIMVLYRLTGAHLDSDDYYVIYDDITGLNIGSPVSFGGYPIGQVSQIEPVREQQRTRFRLTLALRSQWPIPEGSVARIVLPGMLSDHQIDIREAESETLLAPGATLRGQEEISMMSILNEVAFEVKDVSDTRIKPLLDTLHKHFDSVGTELSAKLPEITGRMQGLLSNLDDSAIQLKQLFSPENRTRVEEVVKNAQILSRNLRNLSTEFNKTRENMDRLISNADTLVKENRPAVKQAMHSLRDSLDVVSRHIDAIVYNLEATSRNMNEFSRRLRDNPSELIRSNAPPDEAASPGGTQ